jgi:chemotaxis protein MotB
MTFAATPFRLVRLSPLALVVALGLAAGGCVRQDEVGRLMENNKSLTARNQELLEQIRGLQVTIADLQARLSASESGLGSASGSQQALRDEIARLKRQLGEMESRLAGIQFGPLDASTDAALAQLAAQYPDLIEYDATRGLIRFKSDITFASGSFELTGPGQQAVAALGRILGSLPSAQQYDVVVVGHTDTQRVRQVAGRRFVDNDELSAFRAISVSRAIATGGVDKRRVRFSGFGESRPAVANSGVGNTPANRRVEVFLTRSLPTGQAAEAAAPAGNRPAAPVAPASNPDMMK